MHPKSRTDSAQSFVILLTTLFICLLAFGLPFVLGGERIETRPDIIVITKIYTDTAVPPERQMTRDAFAALFFTPTNSPFATFTGLPAITAQPTFTLAFTLTLPNTATGTVTSLTPLVPITGGYQSPTSIGGGPSISSRTPSPTPIRTAPPPSTSFPTITPSSTPIPAPTASTVPSETATPEPTETFTPNPTNTPKDTNTPKPTNTPRPTNTHRPTPTDAPPPTDPPPTDPPPTDPPPTNTPMPQ